MFKFKRTDSASNKPVNLPGASTLPQAAQTRLQNVKDNDAELSGLKSLLKTKKTSHAWINRLMGNGVSIQGSLEKIIETDKPVFVDPKAIGNLKKVKNILDELNAEATDVSRSQEPKKPTASQHNQIKTTINKLNELAISITQPKYINDENVVLAAQIKDVIGKAKKDGVAGLYNPDIQPAPAKKSKGLFSFSKKNNKSDIKNFSVSGPTGQMQMGSADPKAAAAANKTKRQAAIATIMGLPLGPDNLATAMSAAFEDFQGRSFIDTVEDQAFTSKLKEEIKKKDQKPTEDPKRSFSTAVQRVVDLENIIPDDKKSFTALKQLIGNFNNELEAAFLDLQITYGDLINGMGNPNTRAQLKKDNKDFTITPAGIAKIEEKIKTLNAIYGQITAQLLIDQAALSEISTPIKTRKEIQALLDASTTNPNANNKTSSGKTTTLSMQGANTPDEKFESLKDNLPKIFEEIKSIRNEEQKTELRRRLKAAIGMGGAEMSAVTDGIEDFLAQINPSPGDITAEPDERQLNKAFAEISTIKQEIDDQLKITEDSPRLLSDPTITPLGDKSSRPSSENSSPSGSSTSLLKGISSKNASAPLEAPLPRRHDPLGIPVPGKTTMKAAHAAQAESTTRLNEIARLQKTNNIPAYQELLSFEEKNSGLRKNLFRYINNLSSNAHQDIPEFIKNLAQPEANVENATRLDILRNAKIGALHINVERVNDIRHKIAELLKNPENQELSGQIQQDFQALKTNIENMENQLPKKYRLN